LREANNTPTPATARRQGETDDFCRLGITPQQQQQQQNIYFLSVRRIRSDNSCNYLVRIEMDR
jgi:hypothetical protein